ncbi:MaoC family dehydratase [Dietzia sp. ANT_WB102]|nr:MaoC family dehydratase [Dietzia sp. ANT_WB102]
MSSPAPFGVRGRGAPALTRLRPPVTSAPVSTDNADDLVVVGDPVTVTDEVVARFAEAVGAPAGQVPVTLAASLTAPVQRAVMEHSALRIDLARTLHTAQSSEHHRPIRVGDVLTATATVTGVRSARGGRMIGFDTVLRDAAGDPVQTLSSALLTAEVQA